MIDKEEQNQSPECVKETLEQLVALVINQDHVAQGWLKFLITLQAALFAATSYIFAYSRQDQQWFKQIAGLLIPIIGITTCIPLTLITLRERKWQCWYVQKANALPSKIPQIFPPDYGRGGNVGEQHLDYISKVVICFSGTIVVFWILFLITSLAH